MFECSIVPVAPDGFGQGLEVLGLGIRGYLASRAQDDTSQHQLVPSLEEDALQLEISPCPFAEACREWGVEEYGRHFCDNIDTLL